MLQNSAARTVNIIRNSLVFQVVYLFVLCFHLCLSFWKPATVEALKASGLPGWMIGVEFIFIAIEGSVISLDILNLVTVFNSVKSLAPSKRILKFSLFEDSSTSTAALRAELNQTLFRLVFVLVVLLVVLLDWFLITASRFSIEYYFPIRIVLVIAIPNSVRNAFMDFARTVYNAIDELLVYFGTILFFGVTGVVLFSNVLNVDQIQSGFGNVVRAGLTMFTYISTGANFGDLVYQIFAIDRVSLLYFVVATIIGNYVILSLVLSSFVDTHAENYSRSVRQRQDAERSSLYAVFSLLDVNGLNHIPSNIMKEFISAVKSRNLVEDDLYVKNMEKKSELNLFVKMFERMSAAKNIPRWIRNLNITDTGILGESCIHHKWATQAVLLLVIVQMAIACFYGLAQKKTIDLLFLFLIIANVAEIGFKLRGYGPRRFFYPTAFPKSLGPLSHPSIQIANRVDFVVCIISLICWIAALVESKGFPFADSIVKLRFGFLLITIRIFTQISFMREQVFPMLLPEVFREMVLLIWFLIVALYAFAIYGILLFHDVLDPAVLGSSFPTGDFDTLWHAILVLYNQLVNFDSGIMYATIAMTTFYKAWFYVLFVLIGTLLFNNIFISLVLTVFDRAREDLKDQHGS
jgi:hypothetical protein